MGLCCINPPSAHSSHLPNTRNQNRTPLAEAPKITGKASATRCYRLLLTPTRLPLRAPHHRVVEHLLGVFPVMGAVHRIQHRGSGEVARMPAEDVQVDGGAEGQRKASAEETPPLTLHDPPICGSGTRKRLQKTMCCTGRSCRSWSVFCGDLNPNKRLRTGAHTSRRERS